MRVREKKVHDRVVVVVERARMNLMVGMRRIQVSSFCHSHAFRLVGHFGRLLPLRRDVWGLSNPCFFCDEPWETLEEMAQAYESTIEQHARDAALMLGGQFLFCVEIRMMVCLTQRVRSCRLILWMRRRL